MLQLWFAGGSQRIPFPLSPTASDGMMFLPPHFRFSGSLFARMQNECLAGNKKKGFLFLALIQRLAL